MAIAILQSQGCLAAGRFNPQALASPRNNADYRSNPQRSRRRKRSPSDNGRQPNRDRVPVSSSSPLVEKFPSKGLVMGQVKILKRGEELKKPSPLPKPTKKETGSVGGDGDEHVLCTTDRLGPDPEVVKKHVMLSGLYAGSAVGFTSPPPSSLPFPSALVRMRCGAVASDLRRMLKI